MRFERLEKNVKDIEKAIGDLDNAALEIQVGQTNSNLSGGRTFVQCQEGLVNLAKSFAADLNNLVSVIPQGPEKISEVSNQITAHIRDLVTIAKAAAVTTSDTNLQTSILNCSKALADAMSNLLDHCGSPEIDQNTIISRSKDVSNSIGELVGSIKANFVVFKELEATIGNVQQASARLNTNLPPSNTPYNTLKDGVVNAVKAINNSASNLNTADKK